MDVRGRTIASLGEVGAKSAVPQLRAIYDKDPGRSGNSATWNRFRTR